MENNFQKRMKIMHLKFWSLFTQIYMAPLKPSSLGGSNYFITSIDDFSRKSWAYFLEYKSKALTKFKYFKTKVEK